MYDECEEEIKKYIDFDKNSSELYNNYYLNNQKIVLKIPIKKYGKIDVIPEIDKFQIENSVFITSY